MRVLVACAECSRQYDASQMAEGARFRCLCGAVVQVTRPEPHDAAVVRCSSCGAPRQESGDSCQFCGADFTLHEQDLHTICPGCMTRVSDRARFCHHCASPLLPAAIAGEPSQSPCPVCGEASRLTSRRVGEPGLGVLECPRCAGLWLATDELQVLLQRVRTTAAGTETEQAPNRQGYRSAERVSQQGALYRSCPVCAKLMHRRNFGRKSGIIVDQCGPHGYWFDHQELEAILRWVRQGGESQVARVEHEERQLETQRARIDRDTLPLDTDWAPETRGAGTLVDVLGWLVSRLL